MIDFRGLMSIFGVPYYRIGSWERELTDLVAGRDMRKLYRYLSKKDFDGGSLEIQFKVRYFDLSFAMLLHTDGGHYSKIIAEGDVDKGRVSLRAGYTIKDIYGKAIIAVLKEWFNEVDTKEQKAYSIIDSNIGRFLSGGRDDVINRLLNLNEKITAGHWLGQERLIVCGQISDLNSALKRNGEIPGRIQGLLDYGVEKAEKIISEFDLVEKDGQAHNSLVKVLIGLGEVFKQVSVDLNNDIETHIMISSDITDGFIQNVSV